MRIKLWICLIKMRQKNKKIMRKNKSIFKSSQCSIYTILWTVTSSKWLKPRVTRSPSEKLINRFWLRFLKFKRKEAFSTWFLSLNYKNILLNKDSHTNLESLRSSFKSKKLPLISTVTSYSTTWLSKSGTIAASSLIKWTSRTFQRFTKSRKMRGKVRWIKESRNKSRTKMKSYCICCIKL